MLLAQALLVIIHAVLALFALVFKKMKVITNKVSYYLYFTGTMRLLIEGYLDFMMFALINLKEADWSGTFPFVDMSNSLAIVLISITMIAPCATLIFLALKFKEWSNE